MPKKSKNTTQHGFSCGCGKTFKFYASLREHRMYSKCCTASTKEIGHNTESSASAVGAEKSSPSKGPLKTSSSSGSRSPSPKREEKEPIDMSHFDAIVYFSGDCRPQPGWGAICVLIYDKDQNIVKCHTEALPWFPLGNVKAEYLAFCEAIELAAEFDWIEKLIVIGDSETVYKHWNGHLPLYYSSNNHSMKPMYERAMRSVKHFSSFHYHRCSREENETAKTLSKQTIPGPQSNSSSTRASPLSLPLSTSAAAASEIDPLNDEFDFDDYGDSFVGDSFDQECLDEEFEKQPPVFMASTRTRRRQSSSSSEDSFNIDLKFDAFQISDISHIAGLDDDWLDEDFPQL